VNGPAASGALAQAALRYARAGMRVVPLSGKAPRTENGYKDGTSDANQIAAWWQQWPNANIGILVGPESGICVLDIDPRHGGDRELVKLGELPATRTVDTGGGGTHHYFRFDPRAVQRELAPGVELKSHTGYVVAPPSIHPETAKLYTWRTERQLAEVPQWVIALCTEPKSRQPATTIPTTIPEGQRNATLASIAGTMRRRACSADSILAALRIENERCRPPLEDEELQQIANSVARYAPSTPSAPAETQAPRVWSRAAVTRLADVQPLPVEWLWKGYIPLGMLTVLDGDPGLGKSTALLDIAARLSRGDAMPDGSLGAAAAGVVILSAEDDLARVIRPRLDAMEANVGRIVTVAVRELSGELHDPTICSDDLEAVEQAITEVGARLVIVDPLMAFLPADVNAHRDQDVRRALRELRSLAERTGATVVVIRHFNKAQGGPTLYRGGGSIGIIGAARSGLVLAPDPDDETGAYRVLAVAKSNLSPPVPAFRLRLVADNEGAFPRVSWEGTSTHTAASLLAVPADAVERSALEDAVAFLRDLLGTGAVSTQIVQQEAKRAGVSERTLRRAKDRLRIKARHDGQPGGRQAWSWELPNEPPKVATSSNVGSLGASDGRKPLCEAVDTQDGQSVGDGHLGMATFAPVLTTSTASPNGADFDTLAKFLGDRP